MHGAEPRHEHSTLPPNLSKCAPQRHQNNSISAFKIELAKRCSSGFRDTQKWLIKDTQHARADVPAQAIRSKCCSPRTA
jgi:hypothetical protein